MSLRIALLSLVRLPDDERRQSLSVVFSSAPLTGMVEYLSTSLLLPLHLGIHSIFKESFWNSLQNEIPNAPRHQAASHSAIFPAISMGLIIEVRLPSPPQIKNTKTLSVRILEMTRRPKNIDLVFTLNLVS